MRVRQAVETLFEGFKGSDRDETAWARRLLSQANPSNHSVQAEIQGAMARYCPNVPAEFVPFVVELLAAGIRLARLEEEVDSVSIAQNQVYPRMPTLPLRDTWCTL